MNVVLLRHRRRRHVLTAPNGGRELLKAVRENWEMVLLALILLAGVVLGAIYARAAGFQALDRLDFIFAGNFKARRTEPYLSIFTASFASSFIFILTCFLCGLSMWGIIFVPAVILFRGFGMGLTSGYLYAAYGWKGILYNFSVILPGAFFCCLAILMASLEAMRFSRLLASGCRDISVRNSFRDYAGRFGAILLVACLAAGVDLLLSICFGWMFSF